MRIRSGSWWCSLLLLVACSDDDAVVADAGLGARDSMSTRDGGPSDSGSPMLDARIDSPDADRADSGVPVVDSGASPDAGATAEPDAAPSACACEGLPGSWRCLRAFNRCTTTVWLEAQGNETPAGALDGRTELAPGACRAIAIETLEAGRLWGNTGCEDGSCDTAPGVTPVTLAELTLGELDFYDLSLVDGFNLPMSLAPVEGTFERAGGGAFDCGAPACAVDLNVACPAELAHRPDDGPTLACLSGCTALGTDALCCRGAHSTPETCPPSDYSRFFKDACPDAYSYAYDDAASTYTCRGGAHYDIVFCP